MLFSHYIVLDLFSFFICIFSLYYSYFHLTPCPYLAKLKSVLFCPLNPHSEHTIYILSHIVNWQVKITFLGLILLLITMCSICTLIFYTQFAGKKLIPVYICIRNKNTNHLLMLIYITIINTYIKKINSWDDILVNYFK